MGAQRTFLEGIRMWLLRRMVRSMVVQGPGLEFAVTEIFRRVREAWGDEFTEDNLPTQENHLAELFVKSAR